MTDMSDNPSDTLLVLVVICDVDNIWSGLRRLFGILLRSVSFVCCLCRCWCLCWIRDRSLHSLVSESLTARWYSLVKSCLSRHRSFGCSMSLSIDTMTVVVRYSPAVNLISKYFNTIEITMQVSNLIRLCNTALNSRWRHEIVVR